MNNQQVGYCPRCGTPCPIGTNFCPNCAQSLQPHQPPPPTYTPAPPAVPLTATGAAYPGRKVGILFGFGIFIMPYVFAWFTLRKGHTQLSRIVSFLWLGLVLLSVAMPKEANRSNIPQDSSTNNPYGLSSASKESPKDSALRQIQLDFDWGTGGFGSIMKVDFTIKNPTAYSVKDLEVTCTHYASSGTQIDSNTRTIYELVPAGATKRIKDFNMGFIHSQAKKTSCKIVDLVIQ